MTDINGMERLIKIPVALQIRVDDVGWHNGEDSRAFNGPCRTAMPRNHVVDDYKVLNELGKAIDMKIACSIVIGEWDKDNILRGIPHVTPNPNTWDRASEIDMTYAESCFQVLEDSEFIDYTCHGLLHAYFDGGQHISGSEFYPPVFDKINNCYTNRREQLPIEEFERHIELYFKIFDSWGFRKKVTGFASPCGVLGNAAENENYCRVINKYGIKYWNNSWNELNDTVAVSGGVICAAGINPVHWAAYDVDPDLLCDAVNGKGEPERTDFYTHWPNFLRFHPEYNFERLDKWIKYFKRQAEIFGLMLAKDTGFANSQAVYNRFANTTIEDSKCIIDFTQVDNKAADGLKNEFYISFKNQITPKHCINGVMELYQTKKEFKTYRITRNGLENIIIEF